MLAVRAMQNLGQMWRGDWSDFDGRTLRDQLNALAPLIEAEHAGEDVRERVLGWCDSQGVERPETGEESEREKRLRLLIRGASSEEEAGKAPKRYLWLCDNGWRPIWHTTDEPLVGEEYRGLEGWTIKGWDLDTGEEVLAP